ncbi:MAG: metallophosphoesterase [Candidatus Aureabacteria bacterium]|nr:metallophosphoesterase [Candidatus Auribacterota bacterium]
MGERFKCILESIIFLKEPAKDYVIVITGDLVENAIDPSNYLEARMYIRKLESAGFTVLVVPGNHDYGTASKSSKKFVSLFKEKILENSNVQYPKLDIIDNIAFIGIDSMAEEIHWYNRLFAEGQIGTNQLDRLSKVLTLKEVKNSKYIVVYMHHHPFDPLPFHELKDSKELGNVLMENGNIDALLYGHNHLGKKRHGKWGIKRCYDAGSTTRKRNTAGYHRVIDLSKEPIFDYDADFHGNY